MKLPRIAFYAFVLAFIVLLYLVLVRLSFYLVPTAFAALLAMLMLPLNRKLERLRCPRILAITVSLLLIFAVFFILVSLFTSQIMSFANNLPVIQQQLTEKFSQLQQFITEETGLAADKQVEFLNKELDTMLQTTGKFATGVLVSTGGTLAGIGIMLVHFFLFLLYRARIKSFILQMVPEEGRVKTDIMIEEIAKVTQKYLTGVVTVMAILSVMNSIGLLSLGIPNAIFFGILAAILNVVPYIGVWIGSSLPVFMALISKDSLFYPLGVILIFVVTQFIDNHFLTPRITGSQVRLNALAAIGGIIIGDMVWGFAGMVLFIPMLGMLKIVFDNVDSLHPFGYVIGDKENPEESNIVKRIKRIGRKKISK
jgi:predicted PurR-regulated permease PerM